MYEGTGINQGSINRGLRPRRGRQPQVNRRRRLRKQPRLRRMEAAGLTMPQAVVPRRVKRRRKRNHRRYALPRASVRQVATSARWLSLVLFGVCLYALYFVGMSDDFYLTYIPVEGTVSITPEEIVSASGLAGNHIFAADPAGAAIAIHELPGVVSATVQLRWPNEVLIRIVEDRPVALWVQAGETFWINEAGRLIPARAEAPGLPQIQAETPWELTDETGALTLTLVPGDVWLGARQLAELRPELTALYYRPDGGLSFDDERGWRAYFGVGDDMHQKLVVYDTLVTDLQSRGLQPDYVSVSNQDKPFYRAVGGG